MSGTVEADETFIGGLAKNMHKDKWEAVIKGRGPTGKAIVMGLLERAGKGKSKVRAKVVKATDRQTLHGEIRQSVEAGANVYTDALPSYKELGPEYVHAVVEYVRENVHTNGLGNR